MINLLRTLFIGILIVMTWGTVQASLDQAMFDIPGEVTGNPWFQVTLLDAYFGFITFYVLIAWKEQRLAARILWFPVVILWGNFALAAYMLRELFAVRAGEPQALTRVFTERRPGHLTMPVAFLIAGIAVYLLAAKNLFA